MQKVKSLLRSEIFIEISLLVFISAILYLIFVFQFGYFNDDWYLMYAAGAQGPAVFKDIFIVDRPMRALVMIPAYILFGDNPVNYNISAYIFRVLSAVSFLWLLRMLWRRQRVAGLTMALLFLIYPGFLSQFNGIDYQSQIVSLAAGMFSVALTIYALQVYDLKIRFFLFCISGFLTIFYLGLVEYFIGLEFLRVACIFIVIARTKTSWQKQIKDTLLQWVVASIPALIFLIWRIFFFESERGATDVNLQLGDVLSSPLQVLQQWAFALLNDILDVLLLAWMNPINRFRSYLSGLDLIPGLVISILAISAVLVWSQQVKKNEEQESIQRSDWRHEAIWLGLGLIIFGLLPVILVGRTVDFKSFSRYALLPSAGVALLIVACLSYISKIWLRNIFISLLVISSALAHYANGLAKARETEAVRNFWWQVSWRIPQLEHGATLVTRYSVAAEEDYFTWGPANLIYYPESMQAEYAQPTIYAVLLTQETISKAEARTRQEYSNRRSIVTYPNHRNLLVLTQPTSDSCVHIIDHNQMELSSVEDERVVALAPYSEPEQILLEESFHTPPIIPFGSEPTHDWWCYYYQKASYARQLGDWAEVARLGDEALTSGRGLSAKDPIEWMPFLQAYAYLDNTSRIEEIASFVTSDMNVAQQACQILTAMPLNPSTLEVVTKSFCLEK
jgi:hypothetical protein